VLEQQALAQDAVRGLGERVPFAGTELAVGAEEVGHHAVGGGLELEHLVQQIGGKFKQGIRVHRERLSLVAMSDADLSPLPPTPTGRYRHYKGGEYEVLGAARHSETLEPLVVYRPLYNASGLWVRPHAMFFERVTIDGVERLRFEPVDVQKS